MPAAGTRQHKSLLLALALLALLSCTSAASVNDTLASVRLLAERVTGALAAAALAATPSSLHPPLSSVPASSLTPLPLSTPACPVGEGPGALVVVTFVNEAFQGLLLNWVVFARRANVTRRVPNAHSDGRRGTSCPRASSAQVGRGVPLMILGSVALQIPRWGARSAHVPLLQAGAAPGVSRL